MLLAICWYSSAVAWSTLVVSRCSRCNWRDIPARRKTRANAADAKPTDRSNTTAGLCKLAINAATKRRAEASANMMEPGCQTRRGVRRRSDSARYGPGRSMAGNISYWKNEVGLAAKFNPKQPRLSSEPCSQARDCGDGITWRLWENPKHRAQIARRAALD